MSDLKIVGLAGEANVGKTELARQGLVEPHNFLPVPVASRVKENVVLNQSFAPEDVLDDKTVQSREAMQDEGTRIREEVGEDALLESLDLRIRYYREFGIDRFVVPDVRAENEREHIQNRGGKVFRLTGRGGAQTDETQDHWTEQFEQPDAYDGVIVNEDGRLNQAVQALRSRVKAYVSEPDPSDTVTSKPQ